MVGPRPVFLATATFPLIVCASSCLINEQAAGGSSSSGNKGSAGAAADVPAADDDDDSSSEQQRLLAAAASEAAAGESEAAAAAAAAAADGDRRQLGSGLEKKHSNLPEPSELGLEGGSGSWQQPALAEEPDPASVLLSSEHQLTQGTLHHKHRQQAPRPSPFDVAGVQQQELQASRFGGTAAAAAGVAANTGGTGSFSLRVDLGAGSGSSGSGGQVIRAGWLSMCRSVGLLWAALKRPHLLRPVAFLFVLQVR
jgi:hypothetical protein